MKCYGTSFHIEDEILEFTVCLSPGLLVLSTVNTTSSTGPQKCLEENKVLTTISELSFHYCIIISDGGFKSCF